MRQDYLILYFLSICVSEATRILFRVAFCFMSGLHCIGDSTVSRSLRHRSLHSCHNKQRHLKFLRTAGCIGPKRRMSYSLSPYVHILGHIVGKSIRSSCCMKFLRSIRRQNRTVPAERMSFHFAPCSRSCSAIRCLWYGFRNSRCKMML